MIPITRNRCRLSSFQQSACCQRLMQSGLARRVTRRSSGPPVLDQQPSVVGPTVRGRRMFTCTWMSDRGGIARVHCRLREVGLKGVLEVRRDHGPHDNGPRVMASPLRSPLCGSILATSGACRFRKVLSRVGVNRRSAGTCSTRCAPPSRCPLETPWRLAKMVAPTGCCGSSTSTAELKRCWVATARQGRTGSAIGMSCPTRLSSGRATRYRDRLRCDRRPVPHRERRFQR